MLLQEKNHERNYGTAQKTGPALVSRPAGAAGHVACLGRDDIILSTKPLLQKDGYRIFQHPGSMTGKLSVNPKTGIKTQTYKDGVFDIGVRKDGVINHGFFRPD